MNKTLKTVLITVAVIFVILFAIVMIFGEDTSTPKNPASYLQKGTSATSNQEQTKEPEQDSSEEVVSEEMIAKTLNYDVFDWNGADLQGKVKIVDDITNLWAAKGKSYNLSLTDLLAGIDQEIQQDPDQANIFEKACIVAQIDPLPFFEGIK